MRNGCLVMRPRLTSTIKPDFSDVDSDEPQIVVGKRYEVLFPEKRPFFLENSSFFQTPNPLFFSRRIAQPSAGVRVTGRADSWSYGGLLIDDEMQADGETNSPKAHISMARVQKDLSSNFSLGALLTDRKAGSQRDTVLGVDARYQYDDNWIFQSQLARSEKQEGQQKQSAHLNYLEAKHQGKHVEYLAKYIDISNGFADRLAFLPRTNYKQFHQEVRYAEHVEGNDFLHRYGLISNGEVSRSQQKRIARLGARRWRVR